MLRVIILASLVLVRTAGIVQAQNALPYPSAQQFRSKLLQLTESQRDNFSDIGGSLLYKRTGTSYFASRFHILPSDEPKLALADGGGAVYFIDLLQYGLTPEQGAGHYTRWQALMSAAMPELRGPVASAEYADLKARDYFSQDGRQLKYTLYLNEDSAGYRISLVLITLNGEAFVRANVGKVPPQAADVTPKQAAGKVTPPKVVPKPGPVNKQANADEPLSAADKALLASIQIVLQNRHNGFKDLRDAKVNNGGAVVYTVKGTHYEYDEDFAETIQDNPGKAIYKLSLSDYESSDAAKAFRKILTPALRNQGYTYGKETVSGNTRTATITYKGQTAATCIEDTTKHGETNIMVYGNRLSTH